MVWGDEAGDLKTRPSNPRDRVISPRWTMFEPREEVDLTRRTSYSTRNIFKKSFYISDERGSTYAYRASGLN